MKDDVVMPPSIHIINNPPKDGSSVAFELPEHGNKVSMVFSGERNKLRIE